MSKKKEGSIINETIPSHLSNTPMRICRSWHSVRLNANPLPKRHRACPSVSLDKEVMRAIQFMISTLWSEYKKVNNFLRKTFQVVFAGFFRKMTEILFSVPSFTRLMFSRCFHRAIPNRAEAVMIGHFP